jgi:hypothetical protein
MGDMFDSLIADIPPLNSVKLEGAEIGAELTGMFGDRKLDTSDMPGGSKPRRRKRKRKPADSEEGGLLDGLEAAIKKGDLIDAYQQRIITTPPPNELPPEYMR